MLTRPIQDDRMNMTENFEHDLKIHTDKHWPSNLSKNIINITTMTNINVWIWPKLKELIKTYIGIIYSYSNLNTSITYYHWKIIALAGIWTLDLPSTKLMSYQWSYPGLDHVPMLRFVGVNFFQSNSNWFLVILIRSS